MAVPEQTPYIEHTGNGITTSFALGFQCETKDHLIVLIDDIEPPIETWSLSGGNVVFTTAPAAGKKITLQRNTPFNRNAEYQSFNNSFRPQTVNIDFDRIWWKLQELGVADWLMKLYVDRLHQQQEQKINDLKVYVDDRDDELRVYLLEEIRKQGVALDQLDEYYNYLMRRLAQIAVDKGWDASFIVSADGSTQQEINDFGGAKWRDKPLGYDVGATVKLNNGDIVKSTIDGNTNDPNVNMTGWVEVNAASQIKYSNGQSVQAALYYLTPEMFGAKGNYLLPDGTVNPNPHDDYQAIQSMLYAGAVGCTFEFDGSKSYYNAFDIDDASVYVDHYNAAADSKQWTRKLGATFKFNGCKLVRRTPTGDIEDVPNKTKYSDHGSAVLLVKDASNVYINLGNISGAGTLGTFVDTSNNQIPATANLYYVSEVETFGIRLLNCKNVFFSDVTSEKAYFNIFIDQCDGVYGNIIANYSVQAPIRSYYPNDMNLGAGVKVWYSKNVCLHIIGKYNANATAEIEKGNSNVEVTGYSDNDFSNSMTILATQRMRFDWSAKNVLHGNGVFILSGSSDPNDTIIDVRGKLSVDTTSYAGLFIRMQEGATSDFYGIDIDVLTSNNGFCGVIVENNSANNVIKGLKINHWSHNDNGTLFSRAFKGKITGSVTGGSSNCTYGLFVQGVNTKNTCLRFKLDLRECAVPWVIDSTAFAELDNTITSENAYFITANVPQNFGSAEAGLNYTGKNEVRFYQNLLRQKGSLNVIENLTNAHGNEKFRLYYDAAAGASTTGGTIYPIKIFVPTS